MGRITGPVMGGRARDGRIPPPIKRVHTLAPAKPSDRHSSHPPPVNRDGPSASAETRKEHSPLPPSTTRDGPSASAETREEYSPSPPSATRDSPSASAEPSDEHSYHPPLPVNRDRPSASAETREEHSPSSPSVTRHVPSPDSPETRESHSTSPFSMERDGPSALVEPRDEYFSPFQSLIDPSNGGPERQNADSSDITYVNIAQMPGAFKDAHHFTMYNPSFSDQTNNVHVYVKSGFIPGVATGMVAVTVLNAKMAVSPPPLPPVRVALSSPPQCVTMKTYSDGSSNFTNEITMLSNILIQSGQESKMTIYLPHSAYQSHSPLHMNFHPCKILHVDNSDSKTKPSGKGYKIDVCMIQNTYGTGIQSWQFALYTPKLKNLTSVKSLALWGVVLSAIILPNAFYSFESFNKL
ncbi:hypothetical protein BDQ17DRAFT_1377664 [Cyathus striatus]|nr:hypothetical protein BDQ17DRAFT_1377664 [Cyathus striatus]